MDYEKAYKALKKACELMEESSEQWAKATLSEERYNFYKGKLEGAKSLKNYANVVLEGKEQE